MRYMGGEKNVSKRKGNTYFLGKTYERKSDVDHIKQDVAGIDRMLESLGFSAKVREANILEGFYEYYIEVAYGTDLTKLERRDKEFALELASPTGKVYWQIPVPGKSFVGLKVPRIPSKPSKRKNPDEETNPVKRNLKMKFACVFYSMGRFNFNIAQRIIGVK